MDEEGKDGKYSLIMTSDSIHQSLSTIRKESLDIYNRLHSINEDVSFVAQVHEAFLDLPILPNLRCGAWYTDPTIATKVPAYFKSTDGHFGNWSFNLRRANLHLLPLIIQNAGIILVDSTRSGKRIPDALSKTVPIWCAVINRAMLQRYPGIQEEEGGKSWVKSLYTPPGAVSAQEHDQIERHLNDWAKALAASSFELPQLPSPLRPFWITPATSSFPSFPTTKPFLPVICVSASKQVEQGTERRTGGFSYIQGSGDDHELWGMGLTPQLFWQHRIELLNAERLRLPSIVTTLVSSHPLPPPANENAPTPIGRAGNRLSICTLSDVPHILSETKHEIGTNESKAVAYILLADDNNAQELSKRQSDALCLRIPEGKKGQHHFLQEVLPTTMQFIGSHLSHGLNVCVACPSGKDHSIGVVLAALSQFFDDKGEFLEDETRRRTPDKKAIRTRLEWIISSRPEANPSRSTLKRVNEFLLSPPSFRSAS